jgi:aerobic carbon-monoxide dehydrogenase medium subunit
VSGETLYARPRSLDAAAELLGSLGAGAALIAGGQELMPGVNYGVFLPTVFVDINALPELKGIMLDSESLSIGALCVHREIEQSALVQEHAPLLAYAVSKVGGGWQVRNRGTIGGNIVCMHPLYDTLPALIAVGASVLIRPAGDSYRAPLREVMSSSTHGLGVESILVQVIVPRMTTETGWGYYKLKSTHGAYASAIAASLVTTDPAGRLSSIRMVLGAVEALPRDVSDELQTLQGKLFDDDEVLEQIERICSAAVRDPISDQRGNAEYRRAMAGVSARRSYMDAAVRSRVIHQSG